MTEGVGFVNGVLRNAQGFIPLGDRSDSLGTNTKSFDNLYLDAISFNDGSHFLNKFITGSFTPTLSFNGASVGMTYSKQYGRYTRIGDMVFVQFTITLTNKGSSTGIARVAMTGAPTVNATEGNPFPMLTSFVSLSSASYKWALGLSNTGTVNVTMAEGRSAGIANALTATQFANNSVVQLTGCYFTDDA